eukprot:TRINITY_DN41286_c0_g1_i1.p1 TRINITY_DN41286_c0_g1~~TRINITY_DN41286_c0_g1_i1.p1  ORF type:complete len:315 (+),score=52.22 TRINITY_DN41286_c0_g1_i1:45-989(+)
MHVLRSVAMAAAILVVLGLASAPLFVHGGFDTVEASAPVLVQAGLDIAQAKHAAVGPVAEAPLPSSDAGWSHDSLEAVLRSLLAGLSTSLGAAVVLMLPEGQRPSPDQMAFALALAGGVMLTVSFVEMWLPQLFLPDNRLPTAFAAAVGILSFLFLKYLVPEPEYAANEKKADADLELNGSVEGHSVDYAGRWRLAVLLTCALTAHNFPEGLAVAISSLESQRLGLVVMSAIAMHNIPEGIAIAMPVLDATGSRWRAMQMATSPCNLVWSCRAAWCHCGSHAFAAVCLARSRHECFAQLRGRHHDVCGMYRIAA